MLIARQSTARTVTVGPVLDADGVAVTGGVVGDFKVAKNGGAPAALNGSATLTHRATGHYSLALTASDLDTVGQAEIIIDDTVNACPVKEITVIEEAVYDAFYAASAVGYVANAPVMLADGVAHGGTLGSSTATLALSRVTVASQTVDTDGITVSGNGTGNAVSLDASGGTGHGLALTGGTGSGVAALRLAGSGSNGRGLYSTGAGTGQGAAISGGATANGLAVTGGGTSGSGIVVSTTSGDAINATATGAGKHGLYLQGGAAVSTAAAGQGLHVVGGAASTSSGGTAGYGVQVTGGAGAASTNGAGVGVYFAGGGTNTVASDAHGLSVAGTSTGSGAALTSGAGATGNGLTLLAASTNGHGLKATGTGTGDGMELTAGASGADLDADRVGTLTGNITGDITGSLSGSVGSVTGAVGSVTGGVTLADGVAHGGTPGSSTATFAMSRMNITSQTTNTAALTLAGNGSGAGMLSTGGATGNGALLVGGATSGNGIYATATTSGSGMRLDAAGNVSGVVVSGSGTGHGAIFTSGGGATGNGLTLLSSATNGHGLKSTGSGTGDGAELTAGASGADLDADITGNITGNLSGSAGSVTGGVTVTTNNDKTGYSLTQSFPSNFASLAITAGGIVQADLQTIKTQTVTCAAGVTVLASVGTAATSTAQTGDAYGIVNSGTHGNAAIKADTAAILTDTGTDGVVVASGSKAGYSLAAAGMDAVVIETGMNARQALSIIASSGAGVLAGAATTTVTIAAAGVPATNRITATVDSSGNRSAVTLSLPA